MKTYKKVLTGVFAVSILGTGLFSSYLTFCKTEDTTSTININPIKSNVKISNIKYKGLTSIIGMNNGKLIGHTYETSTNPKNKKHSICTYDIKTKTLQYIEGNTNNVNSTWAYGISPDNKTLIYSSGENGWSTSENYYYPKFESLRSYDFGTKKITNISNKLLGVWAFNNANPYSQNGRYISFDIGNNKSDKNRIFIYDKATGKSKMLDVPKCKAQDPVVSEDGKRVYFIGIQDSMSPESTIHSINIYNPKDIREEVKRSDEDNFEFPVKDGNKKAFASSYCFGNKFYLIDNDKSIICTKGTAIAQYNLKEKWNKILVSGSFSFTMSHDKKRLAYLTFKDDTKPMNLYVADIVWRNGAAEVKNKKFIYKFSSLLKDENFNGIMWSNDDKSVVMGHTDGAYLFNLE